ncbi:MAG TPA: hypothetical protein VHA15_01890 [Burkholderiales bacterium]|jgi:hypothetical protein|nr:hypothetical protein [Burkholderiales bacterium]
MIPAAAGPSAGQVAAGPSILAAGLCLATILGYLAWASGRGIDITDNGYYLLSSAHPDDVLVSLTSAHEYTARLLRVARGEVAAFRVVGAMLMLASSVVLFAGLRRALRIVDGRGHAAHLALFVALGCLSYYGWTLLTPGYNLLNAVALQCSAGSLLLAMPGPGDSGRGTARRQVAAALLAGASAGAAFFIKFPTGILLLAASALVVVAWPYGNERRRLMGGLVAGFFAWGLFHFAMIQAPASFLSQWRQGLALVGLLGSVHGGGIVAAYLRDAGAVFHLILAKYGWVYLGVMLVWFAGRRRPSAAWVSGVPAAAFVLFGFATMMAGFHYGGDIPSRRNLAFHAGLLLLILLLLLYCSGPGAAGVRDLWKSQRARLVVVAFLLPLPAIGAIGTGNPLRLNMMLHLGPWLALVSMGLWGLAERPGGRWTLLAGTLLAAGVCASQVVTGGEVSPYRLNAPMSRQLVDTKFGPEPQTLKLDGETAAFVDGLRRTARACGLRPGDDVIAFTGMPGLVYGLDARSPGIPWYSGGYPGSAAANAFALGLVPPARLASAWILVKEGTPNAVPDLAALAIRFPQAYALCGSGVWPVTRQQVQLWRPGGAR